MKNLIRIFIASALLLTGLFLFVACFSYHAGDSSWNVVSSLPIKNVLGVFGAVVADWLLQIFGRLALFIPLACCVFALFLFKSVRWIGFRLTMFLIALIGSALLLGGSVIPVDASLTNAGKGGFLGFYLEQWIRLSESWQYYVGWSIVIISFVFGLKVPVFLICRWGGKTITTTVSHVHKSNVGIGKLNCFREFVIKLFKRKQKETADENQETENLFNEEIIHDETVNEKKSLLRLSKKKKQTSSVQRIEPSFDFDEMSDVKPQEELKVREKVKGLKQSSKNKSGGAQLLTTGSERVDSLELPSSALLDTVIAGQAPVLSKEAMDTVSRNLEAVLTQFGVKGKIIGAHPGPVVTLYEFEPADGIKAARVISLADDIAMKMKAVSVRLAVIPGTSSIGIEMPNAKRETVYIREMVENIKFQANSGALPLILGKDIGGTPIFADLAKMPHLLVAGTTGSGKSVAINTMVLSLLYRFTPAECRMIMVDPKMVELSVYNRIPHLLTPVVVEPEKAVIALKWAVREMEDRYRSMSQLGVRNIDGYNQKLLQASKEGRILTRRVQTGFDPETGRPIFEEQQFDLTPIPYIVIIVDEMADLMGRCGKEVDPLIQRLAQMARAVGIHLILATQRPSVDVITGTIKSNFPSRMSFQVRSKIDSRTILDEQGAERLLGKGDMLFMPAGSAPQRVHGPFVSDNDVERVVHHWELQAEPEYVEAVTMDVDGSTSSVISGTGSGDVESGDLYDKAVAIVLRDKKPTTSYVQRQLRIGYNKAADLIDRMEMEGIISKPNVAGKREIIVPTDNA
ncbi:MAG: DNA translocase FtsK 4TM domain-containing protein [Alphaproteobacteria bacterium]|nr:DNA translocase FtsK 4TM domain-containing protein [Alphaproteobacteria bacterium]